MSVKISGEKYAMMYGPTVGDKVRLADTSLVVEVEKDFTTYGDEIKFGGEKPSVTVWDSPLRPAAKTETWIWSSQMH